MNRLKNVVLLAALIRLQVVAWPACSVPIPPQRRTSLV
jgi:hypothetical protein